LPSRRLGGGAHVGALELKQPGAKPTPLQRARLRRLTAIGVFADWAATHVAVDMYLCTLTGNVCVDEAQAFARSTPVE
jgi:hypothetical protein